MGGEQLFSLGLAVGFIVGCLFILVLFGVYNIRNSMQADKIQKDFDLQVAQAKANRSSFASKQDPAVKVFKRPTEEVVSTISIVDHILYPAPLDDEESEPTGRFSREDLLLIKN
jgi:hypothetical protein